MNGERLKQLREKNGYSRQELAQKVLVSKHEIQAWEEGWYISEPSSGEIEGLAEAFALSEDEVCSVLNISTEDGYSEDKDARFIDYVDAGLRAVQYVKDRNK